MEDNKTLSPIDLEELKIKYAPFLKEAKKKFFIILYFFVVATILGFIFSEQIVKFLVSLFPLSGINIVFTSPFQYINLSISCGIATGLVLVFPIIVVQILSFLRPALKRKEFRMVTRFLPFSVILFLIGFGFGAYLMKWQIDIFLTKSISLGIGNVLDVSNLLSTVLLVSSLMGLGFQFPIILLVLMRLEIVKRKQLAKRRLWIYLFSFVFAMFLPADSILIDVFLALPLIVLFEISLLLGLVYKKK